MVRENFHLTYDGDQQIFEKCDMEKNRTIGILYEKPSSQNLEESETRNSTEKKSNYACVKPLDCCFPK